MISCQPSWLPANLDPTSPEFHFNAASQETISLYTFSCRR